MKRLLLSKILFLSLMLGVFTGAMAQVYKDPETSSAANQEYVSNIYPTLDAVEILIADPGDDPAVAKEKLDTIMLSIDEPLGKASHLSRVASKGDDKQQEWFAQQLQAWQQVASIATKVVDYQVRLVIHINLIEEKLLPVLERKKERYLEVWEEIQVSLDNVLAAQFAEEDKYKRALKQYESMVTAGGTLKMTLRELYGELSEFNKAAYEPITYENVKMLALVLNPNIAGEPELEKRVISWKALIDEKFTKLELVQDDFREAARPITDGTLFRDHQIAGEYKFEKFHGAMKKQLHEIEAKRGKHLRKAP